MADFEALVTQVVNEEIKRYEDELAKAFQAAKSSLDQKYQATQLDYQAKLKAYLSRAKEKVEGEKAKLEIETKRAVSQQKEAWLEKVYAQARERLTKEFVNSKEYEQILRNLVSKNAKDGAVIYCSPRDSDKVKNAVKGMKVQVVEDQKVSGGIRIFYPEEGLSRDFTLDLILNQVFEDLKGQIASVLFGERA
ncbi:MAG: V-type ATP synthase subunit E [Thermoprotei archaeon]